MEFPRLEDPPPLERRTRYQLRLSLATDAARNVVYASALMASVGDPEDFRVDLADQFIRAGFQSYPDMASAALSLGPPADYHAWASVRSQGPYRFGTEQYSNVASAAEDCIGHVWKPLSGVLWGMADEARPSAAYPADPPGMFIPGGGVVPRGLYAAAAFKLSRVRGLPAKDFDDRHLKRLALDLEAEFAAVAVMRCHPASSPQLPDGLTFDPERIARPDSPPATPELSLFAMGLAVIADRPDITAAELARQLWVSRQRLYDNPELAPLRGALERARRHADGPEAVARVRGYRTNGGGVEAVA